MTQKLFVPGGLAEVNSLGENGILAMIRLSRRYEAFSQGNGFPLLANMILPVTNVDEVLRTFQLQAETLDLRGAGGLHVAAMTVPNGRKRSITAFSRGSSAADTRVQVEIAGVRFSLTTSAQVIERDLSLNPVELGPGDSIGMLESGNAADATVSLSFMFYDEIAF